MTKEKKDLELLLKLWQDRIITDPDLSFQVSDKKKIEGLVARGVFVFKQFNASKYSREQIFKLQIVYKVKGKTTPTLFEKSCLVIQIYNDLDKEIILTQSPTIQHASQRLIIALALTLMKLRMILWIWDITQAYTQLTTLLQRMILTYLLKKIEELYSKGTIMTVLKLLYSVAETGIH